jgi:hypothetical protein
MCCAALLALGLGPRIAFLFVWIFGSRVDRAFDSWIWPLLLLFFLPWTGLAYILVWDPAGLSGGEWVVVALGFVADIATYSSRAARSRMSSAY